MRSLIATAIATLVIGCSSTGGSNSSGSSGASSSSGDPPTTSSTSSGSSSTQKFSCSLNGDCYKCPSSQAVIDCANPDKGPSAAGCSSTDSSFCQ